MESEVRLSRRKDVVANLPDANIWLGFLADEERVLLRGREALAQVEQLFQINERVKDFVACNLLALLLFRHGDVAAAQALCRAEIKAANKNQHLGIYALQAQINLLRIEGFTGDPDVALAALSGLDEIAAGRPSRLPEFEIGARCIGMMPSLEFRRISELARSARVVDTCKILWRHDRRDELVEQAREFLGRWPDLRAGAEPHHAGEVDWLVSEAGRESLSIEGVNDRSVADSSASARCLHFIRLVHEAAALAGVGERFAARTLAIELCSPHARPQGPYASAVTPARWLGSLGDTLLRTGDHENAADVLFEAEQIAEHAGDQMLVGQLRQRLGKVPFPEHALQATVSMRMTADDLAGLVELALSRLSSS